MGGGGCKVCESASQSTAPLEPTPPPLDFGNLLVIPFDTFWKRNRTHKHEHITYKLGNVEDVIL